MRYILFIRDNCPFCDSAIELLAEKKLPFKIVRFDKRQTTALNEVKAAYDWDTVPLIFKREGNNITFIGGFTDLERVL